MFVERAGGAIFNSPVQKDLFARYAEQAVTPEHGHLEGVQAAAKKHGVTVVLGMIERPAQRSGSSLYCSIAYIDGSSGAITAIHRKIMPTYDERLVWSVGDGAGIVTHPLTVNQAASKHLSPETSPPPSSPATPPPSPTPRTHRLGLWVCSTATSHGCRSCVPLCTGWAKTCTSLYGQGRPVIRAT